MHKLNELWCKACVKCNIGHMRLLNYCNQHNPSNPNGLTNGMCRHKFNTEHHVIQCDVCHFMIYEVSVV
jgi:hypothetical protein